MLALILTRNEQQLPLHQYRQGLLMWVDVSVWVWLVSISHEAEVQLTFAVFCWRPTEIDAGESHEGQGEIFELRILKQLLLHWDR